MPSLPIEEEIPQFVEEKNRYIEIYKITNIITGKLYIGQTVSHMLNHNKYRRYGSQKRLDCHFSEAMKNNKDKECRYLNNSIRKHGIDKFIVELIDTCSMDKGDEIEAKYITEYNSIFPFGYNLKIGGTVFKHSDESRRILSEGYYKSHDKQNTDDTNDTNNTNNNEVNKNLSIIKSLDQNKLERFKNTELPEDIDNSDKYIRIANLKNKKLLVLKIGEIEISFGSKKKTIEDLKQDIIDFIKKLKIYKNEHNKSAKLLDVPEYPKSNDNFAENNEHIASKDEYLKSIEIYKQHLKQKKDKKQFDLICIKCNIQKNKEDFRGKHHTCRKCENIQNTIRNKKNKDKRNKRARELRIINKDKISARRKTLANQKKLALQVNISNNTAKFDDSNN